MQTGHAKQQRFIDFEPKEKNTPALSSNCITPESRAAEAAALSRAQRLPLDSVCDGSKATNGNEAEISLETHTMEQPKEQQTDFVRNDRQITYPNAVTHYDWPPAKELHDRDTISVERVSDNNGNVPHRFIIKRGDTVNAYFSNKKIETGKVTGISHARKEVRVSFGNDSKGIWFSAGAIYPAPEPEPTPTNKVPLSKIIEKVNSQFGEERIQVVHVTDASEVTSKKKEPYTFDNHKQFVAALRAGTVTLAELKDGFSHLLESKLAFVADLKSRFDAKKLKLFAARLGEWSARSQNKQQNAESIHRKLLHDYHLADGFTMSMGDDYEAALKNQVMAQTEEDLAQYLRKRSEKLKKDEKALTNPESLDEFTTFIRERGEENLTDEQLATFDALRAERSREQRATEKAKDTVERFESEELSALELSIKEGYHDKKHVPLWIVQLGGRVPKSAYNEMKIKAKMLGGWYSSFKKSDAGFQFYEKDSATRFVTLTQGDANREDILERRKARREQTASERLHELASDMLKSSEDTLETSKNALQNTPRRADIQLGVRGQAHASAALARTIHSIAESLSTGAATYLDGIRHRTQVSALDSVLRLARWERIRHLKQTEHESNYDFRARKDAEEEKKSTSADIRFAKYPFPSQYKRNLEEAIEHCKNKRGVKQAANQMAKRLRTEKDSYVTFRSDHDIEQLQDFLQRAKHASYDTDYLERNLEDFKRIRKSNIFTIYELRAALREYLPHKATTRGDDPVQIAERELIGKKLPGFFPTPRAVIAEMLEYADIEDGNRILEPSCGKGDILDSLKQFHPDNEVVSLELNRTLADVLSAKGHSVRFENFLEHRGEYDRIVMNPPFERGQDIDHVMHAFSLLKDGGKLVSVMSEGPFFRNDRKAATFREWLNERGGFSEKLPENAFAGTEAFRQTGVQTRLVIIER